MVSDQVVMLMQHSHLPNLTLPNLVRDFLFLWPVILLCLCICVNLIELNRTNNVFREHELS
jgi:hypothetical protein